MFRPAAGGCLCVAMAFCCFFSFLSPCVLCGARQLDGVHSSYLPEQTNKTRPTEVRDVLRTTQSLGRTTRETTRTNPILFTIFMVESYLAEAVCLTRRLATFFIQWAPPLVRAVFVCCGMGRGWCVRGRGGRRHPTHQLLQYCCSV